MSEGQGGVSGAPAGSVYNMVCPAARQAGCSLRTAALNVMQGGNGLKESLTECEIGALLSLTRGHRIAVRDHETGALWSGLVDMPFPEHGFVWVITDVGERKVARYQRAHGLATTGVRSLRQRPPGSRSP